MRELEYNATLVRRLDLTASLAIFEVRPDERFSDGEAWFVPGQYVVIGLNNEERPELGSVQRPMSIASAPEETESAEFYIRYVGEPTSKNPLTHLLWKRRAGERIFIRPKPKGKFTVRDTIGDSDPRICLFVSAGTGLAPFVSVVRSHLRRNPDASLGRFAILHGASYPADLGYREELTDLARRRGLRYVPTISRPREVEGWEGSAGRVEDLFKEERLAGLEESLGLDPGGLRPDRVAVFVCGLQGTIGRTIERLLGRGFVPAERKLRRALELPDEVAASIFFEQYDTEPAIDIEDEPLVADLKARLHAALEGC